MPAPRTVTSRIPTWLNWPRSSGSSVRIFCSWRHCPAGIHTQPISPRWSAVTARWMAAVSSMPSLGTAPYSVTETHPAGRSAGGATCSRSIRSTT